MQKHNKPPTILPEQIHSLSSYLRSSVKDYHYSVYFELLAYPRMIAERLRKAKLKDVNVKETTVLSVPVLKPSMNWLLEHIVRHGLDKPDQNLFSFSRQRAHVVWERAKVSSRINNRATIADLKEAFNTYLRIHHKDYKG
jgi:hypothetical protein